MSERIEVQITQTTDKGGRVVATWGDSVVSFYLENGVLEARGDTYEFNQRLRFKDGGFIWYSEAKVWRRNWRFTIEDLAEWLRECIAKRQWVKVQPKVEVVIPTDLPVTLFPHQEEAVRRMVSGIRLAGGFLLADAPRVGKTYAILTTLRILNVKSVLILSPASVVAMWRRELERFSLNGEVMSYELFRRRSAAGQLAEYDFVVADEAHKMKNLRAQVSKEFRKLGRLPKILATGTPAQNGPEELLALLTYLFGPQEAKRIISLGAYFDNNRWGGGEWVWKSNLSALRAELYAAPWFLRRELSDVAHYLPKVSRAVLEANGEGWRAAISEIDDELEQLRFKYWAAAKFDKAERIARIQSGLYEVDDLQAIFPILSKLRALIAKAKAKFVNELVADTLEETDEQFLVFAHHDEVREAVKAALAGEGVAFAEIDGATAQKDRLRLQDEFQAGRLRVLILSTRAAGEGLTLSNAGRAIFAELDWNPAALQQAENRIMNVAQGGANKLIQYVIAPHPLERRMIELINTKAEALAKVYAQFESVVTLDDDFVETI